MKKPRHDLEFMNDLDAIRLMQPHRVSVLFLNVVLAFVGAAIVWAMIARVDEITRGTGSVVPSSHAQIIQSLEGGILRELLIKEGDVVKKGQPLMRLSDVGAASEERGTEAKLLSLQARKARLEAEAGGQDFILPDGIERKTPKIAANEKALYLSRKEEYQNALTMIDNRISSTKSQIDELRSQIESNRQSIGLLNKELTITAKMVAMKAAPAIEEIRLRRQINDADGAMKASQERITGLQSDLNSAEKQKKDQADKFRSQALGELNITETELAGLSENLKSIGDKVDRAELRSPVDGVVNNISVTTLGGVVEPAMKLAEIVPVNGDLKITARVSPNDIAFLKVGQKARVKITAYDSTRYGFLDGELTRIGANSITDRDGNVHFEIEVRTKKNFLGTDSHPLPITSGMIAEVSVITGKKSIMSYFLKPFLRLKDRALSER